MTNEEARAAAGWNPDDALYHSPRSAHEGSVWGGPAVPAHKYVPGDKVWYTGPMLDAEERAAGGRVQTIDGPGWGNDTWRCSFPGGGGRYGGEHLRPYRG